MNVTIKKEYGKGVGTSEYEEEGFKLCIILMTCIIIQVIDCYYYKRFKFGDVFFIASLADESFHHIKYIANSAFRKFGKSRFKSPTKSNPCSIARQSIL